MGIIISLLTIASVLWTVEQVSQHRQEICMNQSLLHPCGFFSQNVKTVADSEYDIHFTLDAS